MEWLKKYWRWALYVLCIAVFLFCAVGGFLLEQFGSTPNSVGVQLVRTMYEFSDLEEAEKNVGRLRSVVSESVWDQITFDNDSRVISTYYKFQAQPSKVAILQDSPGLVVYSLENEYITSDRVFVLEYTQTKRLITEIREYELKGHSWGREGVFDE